MVISKQDLINRIIEKSWAEPDFKEELQKDPKAAVKKAFNVDIPDHVNIKVVEETEDTYYLVLPQNPATLKQAETDKVEAPRWP